VASYKDYYQTLGVSKDASKDDIRRAFRKLAAKHHPDRNPDDAGAEERFKEINEAYTVLSDEEKRRFYDQYGSTDSVPPFQPGATGGASYHRTVSPEEFGDFSDFFQSLFGGFGGVRGGFTTEFGGATGQPYGAQRVSSAPAAAEARLDVGLLDAFRGGPTNIRVGGKSLEVTLPKGVKDGARLRLKGQAPSGGDLILQVRHLPHPTFRLDRDDVRVTVRVPAPLAAVGGPLRVPTLEGEVEMTLPAGSSSGRVLRLRGQGWPKADGSRGDELAEVRLTVPEELSSEQEQLYKQLLELEMAGATTS